MPRPRASVPSRLALLLLLAMLALLARPARAQDVTCDPGDLEVEGLSFAGNRAFSDAQLANGIVVTPSSWWRRTFRVVGTRRCTTPTDLSLDSLRIIVFYRKHGFSQVQVGMEARRIGADAVDVVFRVDEGTPMRIQTFTINGLDSVPPATRQRVLRDLPVRVGGPFDQYAVDSARFLVVRRLRDDGYPEADLLRQTESDTVKRVASVGFDVITGPRAHLGRIVVRAESLPGEHRRVSDASIRRVIGVRPGDLYRQSALEGAKRTLYLTEAFRHVEIEPDTSTIGASGDSTIDVRITLAESYLRAARASVGYGTLDCLRVQGDYSNYNFQGGMRRLDLTARVSKIGKGDPLRIADGALCRAAPEDPFSDTLNYYAAASLRSPRFLRWNLQPVFSLYTERRSEYRAYLRTTPVGGLASLTRQTRPSLPMTFAYQLEYGSTSAQPALFCAVFNVCVARDREKLSEFKRLAVASWHVTRNRADDVLNPTSGSVLSLDLRHASPLVGSDRDLQFDKAIGDASWYQSIGSGNVLVARLRLGLVGGGRREIAGANQFIPPQERLYAGGATTVRGFRQNELGPTVYVLGQNVDQQPYDTVAENGQTYFRTHLSTTSVRIVPTGGNTVVVGNLEARLRSPVLSQFLQFVLFADGGQVWNRGQDSTRLDFRRIRVTPGAGVRIFSLVGPIRVDVGYNGYRRPNGAAYFDASGLQGSDTAGVAPLYCVSPGNRLPVTLGEGGAAATQAAGPCPGTYAYPDNRAMLKRLTFHFSIGQAF